jgi:hypothetical protein
VGVSKKPVSLSLHKSQIERKRRRCVRAEIVHAAKAITSQNNVCAYAVIAMSDDGRCFAQWDTGGVIPLWGFPEAVQVILAEDIAASGVPEDFRKPLIDRAWKGSK